MRRTLALFSAACLVAAACGSDDDGAANDTTATTAAVADEPSPTDDTGDGDNTGDDDATTDGDGTGSDDDIIIGVAASLTGDLSVYDGPLLEAQQMAIDDINEAGGVLGRQLRMITADNRTDLSLVGSATQEVLDQGADFLIPTCDYNFGGPAARIAQEAGIVSITCAGSPLFGFEGIGPLAFSSFQNSPTEGATLAEFAVGQGTERPYLLVDNTIDYTVDACGFFEATFEELTGTEIAGEDTFANPDTSVASQITRFNGADADALVLCSYLPGGATAMRQIRASGFDGPIYTLTTFDGTFWTEAVPDLTDVYFAAVGAVTGDDPDDAVNEFFTRFEERTGEPPLFSLYLTGYSAIQTLALGIERAGTIDGDAVAAAISQFDEEPLLAGPTSYAEECHVPLGRPMRMMQFQDGELSFVSADAPSFLPPSPC